MLPTGMIACARCGKHLPSVATFCDGCGARVVAHAPAGPAPVAMPIPVASARPGFVAAGRGMSVCHGCGAIAPTRLSQCGACGTAIGTSLEAIPPRPDGARWAQLRTELVCRQCGQRSPLDPLDHDGSVSCGKCGSVQAFDNSAWGDALEHAHAVVDLAGPDADGRNASLAGRNPYAEIGVARTDDEHLVAGMTISAGVMRTRNIAIRAAPGHPLCTSCGCPIAIEVRGNEVQSRCPGCGEAAQFRFPVDVRGLVPGLVCAIGDELRVDRPTARLDATSAGHVVAIKCPSCGAGLDVQTGQHFVACTFCKTHCRIPQRTLLALKQAGTRTDPWWALFQGPSKTRSELASGGASTAFAAMAGSVDDDDDDDSPRRRRRRKGKKIELLEQPKMSRSPAAEALAWTLQVGVPLAILLVLGAVFFHDPILKWFQGSASHENLGATSSTR